MPLLDGPRREASSERRRGARPWLSSPATAAREGRTTPCHRRPRSHPRRPQAPLHRRGVPAVPARRPRGLHLRRAREGRDDPSGAAQRRRLRRQALRCPARCQHQGRAHRRHRHRLRRLHAQVLQGRPLAPGRDRPARCDCRLGPHHLRLDGPQPRLQGGLPQHAGRQRRLLRQVRRQRARLAQARPGGRALSQPRAGQSAHRPQQAGRGGQGRLHHHPEGDRRRHLRLRRQGGGHQLGAHPLQLPRPEHGPGDQRPRHGRDVHRPHEHAGHQADLPRLLRAGRRRHRLAVGLPAHLPLRRERRHLRGRQRLHPLGERVHPPRCRAAQGLLPALRLRQRLYAAGLHAACRQARVHRRAAARRPRAPPAWRPSAACRCTSAR